MLLPITFWRTIPKPAIFLLLTSINCGERFLRNRRKNVSKNTKESKKTMLQNLKILFGYILNSKYLIIFYAIEFFISHWKQMNSKLFVRSWRIVIRFRKMIETIKAPMKILNRWVQMKIEQVALARRMSHTFPQMKIKRT